MSHNGGTAAQESERRFQHPAMADGNQMRQAGPVGRFQQINEFRPIGWRFPFRMAGARHLTPAGSSHGQPLGRRRQGRRQRNRLVIVGNSWFWWIHNLNHGEHGEKERIGLRI
jgi:hypothetical protein